MKKAFLLTAITVSLLCIGLVQLANASDGPATGTIATHLVVYPYTFTDASATFVASHFDMVDVDFSATKGLEKIKAANPNIKIIGYRDFMYVHTWHSEWNTINQPQNENWFLHTKYGDTSQYRVQTKGRDAYVMNPSSTGWRNYIANWANAKLTAFPMVDGIFADDVAEKIRFTWDPFSVPVTDLPADIITNWNAYMIGMIRTVKSALGSHLLIINTPDLNGLFIQYCDGQSVEHFLHRGQRTVTDFTQTWPIAEMNLLEKLSATGKIVLAQSAAAIPQNPTPTDIELTHKCVVYCLSGFLLGYSGKASFGFQQLNYDYTGHMGYWDEMDAPIGTPVGAKYNVQGDLWARDFTAGKVFLNIGNLNTYTVNVAGTKYTITPRSGLIALATGGKVNTQITLALSPNPASPGATVTLSGTLKDTANNPVYPAQVRVEYSVNGGATWNSAWTLNTNNAGAFSNTFAAPAGGTYLLRVSYAGSATFNPSTNQQTLTAQTGGKVNTQITLALSPNPASPGATVTLSGTLKDANGSPVYQAQVKVYYSTNGGASWNYIWTLNTNTAGQFSKTFTAPGAGTYLVGVSYDGSASYNPSSQKATLKIQ